VRLGSRKTTVTRLLESKAYRDAYVLEHIKNGIAFQIRTLREDRDWTQGDLGGAMGKPRNVVSRIEDPNYGKTTLTTLREVAAAFDVGLLVKFVPFSRLVREYEDVSPARLSARSITSMKEVIALSKWAKKETIIASLDDELSTSKVVWLSEWASKYGIVAPSTATSAEPGAGEPQQQGLFPDIPGTGKGQMSRKRQSAKGPRKQGKKPRRSQPVRQPPNFSTPTAKATNAHYIASAA
jgi:transcriptional regulator with XRE-family HTH domain